MRKTALLLALLFLTSCGKSEQAAPVAVNEPPTVISEAQNPPKEETAPQVQKEEVKEVIKTEPQPKKEEVKSEEPPIQEEIVEEEPKTLCTISVTCEKLLSKTEKMEEEKLALVPVDGVVLSNQSVEFTEGESVFDLLVRCLAENGISLEYREDVIYKSVYVEGIGGIFEKDCGAYSGWMYKVNGTPPTCGCSEYEIKEGDVIEFYYSC